MTVTDELSYRLARLDDRNTDPNEWRNFLRHGTTAAHDYLTQLAFGGTAEQRVRLVAARRELDDAVMELDPATFPSPEIRATVTTKLNSLIAIAREIEGQPAAVHPFRDLVDKNVAKQISALTEAGEALKSVDVPGLRREELGQLNFEKVLPQLFSWKTVLTHIELEALWLMSSQQRSFVQGQVDAFKRYCQRIKEFVLVQDNPPRNHQTLCQELVREFEESFAQLSTICAYSKALCGVESRAARGVFDIAVAMQSAEQRVATLESTAQRTVDGLAKDSSLRIARTDALIGKAEAQLAKVDTVVAQQIASKQSTFFGAQADKHEKAAMLWLGVSIVLGVLLIAGVVWLAGEIPKDPNGAGIGDVVHFVSIRVISLSIVAYFLVFATRNYTANKHNEVANRHRQNSLSVMSPLMDVLSSETSRDLLLGKIADATFGQSHSGYGASPDRGLSIMNAPHVVADSKAPIP